MRLLPFAAGLSILLAAQDPGWAPQVSGTTARLRGVAAVDARVAWASGTGGTILRTVDGGATWTRCPVPGAEKLDFRDIEAFSAQVAVALSIGPGDASRIFRTEDGGKTWSEAYRADNAAIFLDALAFASPTLGYAMGDPVEGRFFLLRTLDGGRTWSRLVPKELPPVLPGESAFAASGTCLLAGTKTIWLASGGASRSRVFRSEDAGETWNVAEVPISAGTPSAGIFGLGTSGPKVWAVGGNYQKEGSASPFARGGDGGRTWTSPSTLRGFRSAVAEVELGSGKALLAVGPAGCDLSRDQGRTWRPLPGEGLHAFSGRATGWAVGEQGRIWRYEGRK